MFMVDYFYFWFRVDMFTGWLSLLLISGWYVYWLIISTFDFGLICLLVDYFYFWFRVDMFTGWSFLLLISGWYVYFCSQNVVLQLPDVHGQPLETIQYSGKISNMIVFLIEVYRVLNCHFVIFLIV